MAGMDDLYICGPPEVVFPAVEVFWAEVLEVCQLQLERSKTEVFSWGELPAGTPPGLARAGTLLKGVFQPGFILYGSPVGSPAYVQHHLSLKVQEVAIIHPLKRPFLWANFVGVFVIWFQPSSA